MVRSEAYMLRIADQSKFLLRQLHLRYNHKVNFTAVYDLETNYVQALKAKVMTFTSKMDQKGVAKESSSLILFTTDAGVSKGIPFSC